MRAPSFLFLSLLALGACSSEVDDPTQVLPLEGEPNLTLYVSNQSFDIDPVDIRVYLDDELAVEGEFLVEGQHSWHQFQFAIDGGEHTVRAETTIGDARTTHTLEVGDDPRYGVLNFWYHAGGSAEAEAPSLAFDVFDEPPGFE